MCFLFFFDYSLKNRITFLIIQDKELQTPVFYIRGRGVFSKIKRRRKISLSAFGEVL